jgi:hypothetical protein
MRTAALLVLLSLGCATRASAKVVMYDNTTTPTLDTFFYSVGPYLALGDLIDLVSSGTATDASVEMFNDGAAGTFDAQLNLYSVGSPVGSLIGSSNVTGISSVGGDVLDFSFSFGTGITVPQDIVFTLSVSNMSPNMDLGVDMFEPPMVGSSDNTFMISESSPGTFSQLPTPNNENVYFQLSGDIASGVPEPGSVWLVGLGLAAAGIGCMRRRYGAALR